MSSSKSNISNQSSRSNILTLSQDSQSSQLKSHRVNLYYKKFISKLGFLFRIDTQDLDALYKKIAECVEGSDSFVKSSDVNISELIQMAKQLKHNHCLLKNMVEVLDERFLRKARQLQEENSPKVDKIRDEKQEKLGQRTSKYWHKNNKGQKLSTQDQFIGLFNDTLERTKEETRKRRELEQIKLAQKPKQQNYIPPSGQANVKRPLNDRVRKIFQQMKSIKGDLKKIEKIQHDNFKQLQPVSPSETSLVIDQPSSTQRITQSVFLLKNKVEDDEHQMFTQIQPDTYFLQDDRFTYTPESPESHSKIPKLSLRQIYYSMGVDPNDQANDEKGTEDREMGIIRETSRQSGSLNEIQNCSEKEQLSFITIKNNQQKVLQHLQDQIKGKSINNSTSLGNLTQKSQCSTEKKIEVDRQMKEKNIISRYEYIEQRQSQGIIPQASSEKSQSVSNVTIIQKLNFGQKNRRETGSSVLEQSFYNIGPSMKKKENSVYFEEQFQGGPDKRELNKDLKDFRQDLKARNEKSKEKINNYISKLEERNKILQSYITDIEKNLTSEEEQKLFKPQQRSIEANRNGSKSLSNLAYTGNQIMNYKYAPFQNSYNQLNDSKSSNGTKFGKNLVKDEQVGTEIQKNIKNSVAIQNGCSLNTKVPTLLPKLSLGNEVEQQRESFKQIKGKRSQLKNNLYLLQSESDSSQQRHCRKIEGLSHVHQRTQINQKIRLSNMNQDLQSNFNRANFSQKIYDFYKQSKKGIVNNIGLSKISMNSLEERIQKQNLNSEDKSSQQFTIPRVANTSLFDQTRSAESKLDLSEDRGFRPRVVGEQIQRIKGSVNELFKKMKSITQNSVTQSESELQRKNNSKMLIYSPQNSAFQNKTDVKNNRSFFPSTHQTFFSKNNTDKISPPQTAAPFNKNPYLKDMSFKNSRNSSFENKESRDGRHRVIYLNNSRDSNFSFQNPINRILTNSNQMSNNAFNFSRSSSIQSMQTNKNLNPVRPIINFTAPIMRSSSNQYKNGQQMKIQTGSVYMRSPGCSPPLPPKLICQSNKIQIPSTTFNSQNIKYVSMQNSHPRLGNSTLVDQRKHINGGVVLAESEVMKYNKPGMVIREKVFIRPDKVAGQMRVQRRGQDKSSSRGSRDTSRSNRKKGINIVSRKNN